MRSVEDVLPWSDAMGLKPRMTAEEAAANLDELYGDTERGAERRTEVLATLKAMDFQFNAHGVELGQRYHDGAVVSDGTPFPPYRLDPELYYQPTTHPGAHLPHAWLLHGHGRISTLDLARYDRFTLITGIGGQAWIDAAATVSGALNVDVAAFLVGLGQPYDDVLAEWTAIREVKDRGCVLVRPDRVVAWRSMDRVDDPVDALRNVMLRLLANGTTQARKEEESVA